MLDGWGSTCGKCRPNLVSPKTIFPGALMGKSPSQSGGLTLGWLLVTRSIDEGKPGTLVELDSVNNVLTRAGLSLGTADKVIPFDDTFMSSGHALVRRPATSDRTDAFTIRDRKDPGPSANGTFVNSHKLAPDEVVRLSDGDIIKLGATELLFKSLWLPGAASPRS
jgi:pSer/pThr/pTyr-binding forkhead associated (FHA) protein